MSAQSELIARKQAVQARITTLRRQVEAVHTRPTAAGNARRLHKLESELEKLMAEEYQLRLRIDRNR